MDVTLREYQLDMLSRLEKVWKQNRSVMVQMPTGTGKTHLMAKVISKVTSFPPKEEVTSVLVVAHRRELLEQIKQTLATFGISERQVRVESIQKLTKHIDEADFYPSLVVVDEAHHALATTYKVLWEKWPDARFLGLTATPCRLSGEPFTNLFDVLLQSWSINKFIKKEWLSDLDYISVRQNSVTMSMVASLTKRGTDGDFQTKQMATVLDTPESIDHLYRSYKQYADGKKGIVYAINVVHARHIADYYLAKGLRCAVIDSKTPTREREELVEDYRQQALDILVNVDIFSEGFDVPAVEFIQLARPTLSLSKYYQQIGRGMRISKGKDNVIILDQVGLYLIFGLPTMERDWQAMFRGEKKGKGNLKNLLTRPLDWWESVDGRILVNEEMVRVSEIQAEEEARRKERLDNARRKGKQFARRRERKIYGKIEVFRELGLYGIKVGGEVTCPPKFEAIEKMDWLGKPYFGLATIPTGRTGKDRMRTVITKDGEDLHTRITGELLKVDDDVFEYRQAERGRFVPMAWDARYDRYYGEVQHLRIGGTPFFVDKRGTYTLRSTDTFEGTFQTADVLCNDRITIIGNDLFVKDEDAKHYTIAGFRGNCIIVANAGKYAEMAADGKRTRNLAILPKNTSRVPLLRELGLRRECLKGYGELGRLNLRGYQAEMLESMQHISRRNRCIVLQTPIGTGKSVITQQLIREGLSGTRGLYWTERAILFVAHRPEVMPLIARHCEKNNWLCSIIPQNYSGPYGCQDITIVCPRTIEVFIRNVHSYFSPALIIIDEVHSVGRSLCERLKKKFSSSTLIGLSATPSTEDGLPLSATFEKFVPSWSVGRLVKEGWLRDLEVVNATGRKSTTDQITELDDVERLCKSYKKYANGKKGVVFAMDEQHARRIADCYGKYGVSSEVIGFGLSTEEQERLTNEFEEGEVKVLACVDYYSDGMRCPDVDFVQLAGTTDSLNTYLHQVGCAMRPARDDEYGEDGITIEHRKLIVLDHVGLTEKFGLPTDERNWKEMFGEKEEKNAVRKTRKARIQHNNKQKDKLKVEAKPHVQQAPTQTKWQLRMQRLLGNAPSGQTGTTST